MGLRIWLPLINDVGNQGLDDVVVTNSGATSNTSGKIGKCYSFNGSSNYLSMPYNFYNSEYSVCAWVYTTSSTATQGIVCDRTTVGSGFAIFLITGNLRIDCGGNNLQWKTSYAYPVNTWFHVAITYDGSVVRYYINGEFKESKTQAIASTYWGNVTSVGASQANGGSYGNYFNGRLNDVRIYDHCLSPREVKELSKGLVLHYPLAMPGGENLLKNSNIGITSGGNVSSVQVGTAVPLGTTITVSVQIDAEDVVWNSSSTQRRLGTETYVAKSGVSGNQYLGAWAGEAVSESSNIVKAFTGSFHGRVSKTFTTLGELTTSAEVRIYIQGVESGTVKVSNPKLEIGDHATPWVPNTADALYTALGFDDGIEYDVSGNGYNGTKNGDITYETDTPRHNTFMSINDSSSYIVTPTFSTTGFQNSFSIAWWSNVPTFSNKMMWGFGDGVRLNGIYNGNLWNTGDGSNNQIYEPGTTTQITAPSVNTWHHYVMTGNGTKNYLYVDGILYGESKTYKNISGSSIYINGWTNATNYRYDGGLKMSDFRFYSTPLSAEDVLDLYHTPITLANNGTLLTQGEFVES